MGLNNSQKKEIIELIKNTIRNKLKKYKPETEKMPFHFRILGKDRMALFSFIQSLNTAFGTSIFEPIAEKIASSRFDFAQKQFYIGDKISDEAQIEIQSIINELESKIKKPDKKKEVERIRKVANIGNKINELKPRKVDLFVREKDGTVHLFDIKTVKPNIAQFKDFKKTLLEWIAIYLFKNPSANVHSYIAMPYNPYEPEPYKRWTLKDMLDLEEELKVADEFWDFLGGKNTYNDLLYCFEKAGEELRDEIDNYFSKFK